MVLQSWIPFTQGWLILCQVWFKVVKWFWKRRFLNAVNVRTLLFPIERRSGPLVEQTSTLFSQEYTVSSLVEIDQIVLKNKMFNCPQCILAIIFHCKRAWPLIWRNLNPFFLWMLCAKLGLNCPSGYGKEDFLCPQCSFAILLLYILGKGCRPLFDQLVPEFHLYKKSMINYVSLFQWFSRSRQRWD